MVEGARLEIVYTPKGYREFESHPLRMRQHRGDVTKIYQSARVGRQQRYVLTRVRHHDAVFFFALCGDCIVLISFGPLARLSVGFTHG